MKDLIKELTEAFGPPGYEQAVRDIIQRHISAHADEISVDALGNLHAVKRGSGDGLTIMLAAHMDEIGLMVSHISEKGFARFTTLGGVHPDTMVGNRAMFTNGAMGVINIENWPRNDDLTSQQLYLDFGASRKADVPVGIGAVAGFQRPCVDLGHALVAKSLDDRIGCAILVAVLQQLESTPHNVHIVFTVQEEVGLRGAGPAAFKVQPDVSIAVDVTDSGELPERKNFEVKMGHGPAIKVMDRGILAHPALRDWMADTATAHDIPYQLEILTLGSTDATAMQVSREGSIAGALSIACRHIHTPSEMVSYSDVEQAVKLLLAMLSNAAPFD